ncbi:MAG: hypothetical protein ACYDAJ_02570 [Nitrosotalea sp.]
MPHFETELKFFQTELANAEIALDEFYRLHKKALKGLKDTLKLIKENHKLG